MSPFLAVWSLDRPAGLWALLALPVAWWLARRRDVPVERFTGALALWRSAAPDAEAASARRRTPPGFPWLAAALAAAAVALAGPRFATAPIAWTFVVDRTPSMYLAFDAQRTRLDVALERASALRAELGATDVEWASPGDVAVLASEMPSAWRRAPRPPRESVVWSRQDRGGVVWVTDAAPDPSPRRAGLALSGGPAVPGPIGGLGARVRQWDGAQVVEVSRPAAARPVVLDDDLPGPVTRVARAWAEARGLAVRSAREADAAVLHVARAAGVGAPVAVRAGRDGWEARGVASDVGGDGEVWLSADTAAGRIALVRIVLPAGVDSASGAGDAYERPPRLVVGWRELSEPRGDPAAFAVSWAELLDRCALPPPGTVALAERLDAGPGRTAAPAGAGGARPRTRSTALATLVATFAGGLYVATRSRGRRRARPVRSGA